MRQAIEQLNAARVARLDLRFPASTVAACAIGYGWWARTLRSGRGVVALDECGLAHEASPLVRTMLIHAVAIEWLRRDPPGALEALHHEDDSRRPDIANRAELLGWDVPLPAVGPRPPKDSRPGTADQLKSFERMCQEVGNSHLYLAYKLESAYAHPSLKSAHAYLDTAAEELLSEPANAGEQLRAAALMAAIATHAFGLLLDDQPLIAAADSVGALIGTSVSLATVEPGTD